MKNRFLILITVTIFLSLFLDSCRKETPNNDRGIIYTDCIIPGSESSFDIVTLNIKEYPKYGEETAQQVAEMIKYMEADIIALQEISSEEEFDKLVERLIGWEGEYYPINNSIWNLAYLYKVSEISLDQAESKIIFEDDFSAFPRPPFEVHVTHLPTGIEAILINNHLKCCGGSDNEARRRNAADSLHKYVMDNYPDEPVIILGDLNDEINGTAYETNVFWTIVSDSQNFMFADMDIANGISAWWSYPSWPSHIDHICVTDELFANIDTTMVYVPDQCYNDYDDVISDHRPVYLKLK